MEDFEKEEREPKIDCFAYGEKTKLCQALKELVCTQQENCPFYKHKSKIDIREIERDIRNYIGPKM